MLTAIGALSALLTLLTNGAAAAQQINQMIAAAQSQNRDLTDAELATVEAHRKAAIAALETSLGAVPGAAALPTAAPAPQG